MWVAKRGTQGGANTMSDDLTPIAEVPSDFETASVANAAGESPKAEARKPYKASWFAGAFAAVALVSGLGGFAIGQHDNTNIIMRPDANVRPMGDNGMMGGKGPHCNAANGQDVPLAQDGTCPPGTTLSKPGMMGPGNNGMMGPGDPNRGPDPDGDNWTGSNGWGPNGQLPNPSQSPSGPQASQQPNGQPSPTVQN